MCWDDCLCASVDRIRVISEEATSIVTNPHQIDLMQFFLLMMWKDATPCRGCRPWVGGAGFCKKVGCVTPGEQG